jgi:hypothetical protein
MSVPVFVDRMMEGNDYVRRMVGEHLSGSVPLYLDTLRNQNQNLGPYYFAHPKQFLGADPFDTSQHVYPIVGTYFPNTGNFKKTDHLLTGSQEYEVVYEAVIFVTVQTPYVGQDELNLPVYASPGREATMRARDYLMAAVRASILASPSFGTAGTANRLLLQQRSIRESYPDPMKANQAGNPLWLCSGLINVDISATELVANPIIAELEHIELDIDMLPFE